MSRSVAKKKTEANNDQKIFIHSEHLVNSNDSKSLSDIALVFQRKTIATELLHYVVILHHHVFDNTHDIFKLLVPEFLQPVL